jgi:ABC-type sugar transport system substrate-binding protein
MIRRIGILCAAGAVLALGTAPVPPAQAAAAAAKTWCMTYCDAIQLGCRKTVGWFDQDACDRWWDGCMDGCRVND